MIEKMITVIINDINMYEDLGFILTEREIETAEPNIYKKTIVGRSGDLDYTSFYGALTYQNRDISMEFQKKTNNDTPALKYNIEATFNGKEAKVIFSDDPDHYWKGRLTVDDNDDDTYIHTVSMTLDAHPYKFDLSKDEVVDYV